MHFTARTLCAGQPLLSGLLIVAVAFLRTAFCAAHAETPASKGHPTKLGIISSLSSFAASYGQAATHGAELAVEELTARGERISLVVEDDQSATKNAVAAYSKLTAVDRVDGIIGGTWWADALASRAEREKVLLVSCETLFNQETTTGKTTFILQGDLTRWVSVYEPLVSDNALRRGAVVHFVSGFGKTLAGEMKNLFSKNGRVFLGAEEYTDMDMSGAAQIALKVKKWAPDVLYIDAQPGGLATLLRRLQEVGAAKDLTIFTNSILEDVLKGNLADITPFKGVYSTKRPSFHPDFVNSYQRKFGTPPSLNADLGYYAVLLLHEALQHQDPVQHLRSGVTVNGITFSFDSRNVYNGAPQQVLKAGNLVP